jgi:hypothetical protein
VFAAEVKRLIAARITMPVAKLRPFLGFDLFNSGDNGRKIRARSGPGINFFAFLVRGFAGSQLADKCFAAQNDLVTQLFSGAFLDSFANRCFHILAIIGATHLSFAAPRFQDFLTFQPLGFGGQAEVRAIGTPALLAQHA